MFQAPSPPGDHAYTQRDAQKYKCREFVKARSPFGWRSTESVNFEKDFIRLGQMSDPHHGLTTPPDFKHTIYGSQAIQVHVTPIWAVRTVYASARYGIQIASAAIYFCVSQNSPLARGSQYAHSGSRSTADI